MKTNYLLWILLIFSLSLSIYALFIKPDKFDYRTMAAHLVAQPGQKGTLADGYIKKGNYQMQFDANRRLFFTDKGRPFCGLALYYNNHKKLRAMIEFSEGKPHGRAAVYFNNGKIKELSLYTKGLKNGIYQRFNRYGQKLLEGYFKNGLMDGEWNLFFPDGSVRYRAKFIDGVLAEEWFGQFAGFASIPWESED